MQYLLPSLPKDRKSLQELVAECRNIDQDQFICLHQKCSFVLTRSHGWRYRCVLKGVSCMMYQGIEGECLRLDQLVQFDLMLGYVIL